MLSISTDQPTVKTPSSLFGRHVRTMIRRFNAHRRATTQSCKEDSKAVLLRIKALLRGLSLHPKGNYSALPFRWLSYSCSLSALAGYTVAGPNSNNLTLGGNPPGFSPTNKGEKHEPRQVKFGWWTNNERPRMKSTMKSFWPSKRCWTNSVGLACELVGVSCKIIHSIRFYRYS